MNPFLNPIYGISTLKNILISPGRIKRISKKKLENFRNKQLRKIVKYAYNVPLYYYKYKEANVKPGDIREIKDIEKLPFITREDIKNFYPEGIVPKGYNINKAQVLNTSGSTGIPLSFYTDFKTITDSIPITLRGFELFFKLKWRKSKFAYLLNYSSNSMYNVHSVGKNVIHTNVQNIIPLKNHQYIDVLTPLKDIIKFLDDFRPDFIVSNPDTYHHLAILKNKGYGKNIRPKILATGGSALDKNLRNFIEDAFKSKMFEVYGSVESANIISIECEKKTWHIQDDYYHIETVDENGLPVGGKGKVVLTRLYGRGTPFIRYTGMNDIVTVDPYYECNCGLNTSIFKDEIEGRVVTQNIITPDGRLIPDALLKFVPIILNELKTNKIKQYQIIQGKIDEIKIILEVDDSLRDKDPKMDIIFKKIKEAYKNVVGPEIEISLVEVDEIKITKNKPFSNVISYVKPEDVY